MSHDNPRLAELRCWGREQIERWEREERRAKVCGVIAKLFWWGFLFSAGYIAAKMVGMQ